jgi:3'(2'), 5'-bisphosphate nucleotidase
VLGCPNLPTSDGTGIGCLFIAERDGGAFEIALDDPAAAPWPITVDGDPDVTHARYAESVEAAHSDQGVAARIAATLGLAGTPVRMDSQAKYAVVARGDASIYLRIPRDGYQENIWDHAAGLLIVEEAGGIVTDVDGRTLDLTTGRRMTANRGIVAAPAVIQHAVMEAVREAMAAR